MEQSAILRCAIASYSTDSDAAEQLSSRTMKNIIRRHSDGFFGGGASGAVNQSQLSLVSYLMKCHSSATLIDR